MELALVLEISKDQLRTMSGLAEEALFLALKALHNSDPLLGQRVIENDKVINSYEIDIDNSTYNILAVSTVPPDGLRIVLSIQKINAMVERIGDHAVNIAESAVTLARGSEELKIAALPRMADLCKKIFHDALKSFFENKIEIAEDVLNRDDAIDALNIEITDFIKEKVREGSLTFESAMELIRICKNLERVADLSTNIAEETLFAVMGKIVKHQV